MWVIAPMIKPKKEDITRYEKFFCGLPRETIKKMFEAGEFDVASIVFNRFKSAMTQVTTVQQLIPPPAPETTAEAAAPEVESPV